MNELRSRERIKRAIDLLQLESDEHQHEINCIALAGVPARQVGYLLSLSLRVDMFERHQRELQQLLDHPPRLGGAAPGRPVPGPPRPLDQPPGVGLVAA